ncbi:uncharacterized protein LOC127875096 isoform X2 [Dreissena polymorpha]|uniref:BZIP domain-containing protein n=2 Tax=Dreissena polymorpha TaxID=45954 RepID=A0A9D4R4F0_DREPO|nr:uncharacterized protein LOC127875096 isoform X2 [Dreissena polymorpha]KAH3852870.1 hypothetical protein DPMN_095391 [Dreissena polymorpha]
MDSTDFSNLNFAGLDSNLVQATLASISSNTITPIIKEELKLKIQSKRLASGKEELPKPIFKEPEKYEMTPEETEKRLHKRELNRVAAQKCRNKRKLQHESVKTIQAELELRNFTLKRKVEELEKEKQILIKQLMGQQISAIHSNTPYQEFIKDADLIVEHDSACMNPTDQPSTSSGIFRQDCPHRRFSEEFVRPPPPPYSYLLRRYSADVPTLQTAHPNENHQFFTQSAIPVSGVRPFYMSINTCNVGYPNGEPEFECPVTEVVPLQVEQTSIKDALQLTCELFDIPNSDNSAAGDLVPTDGKQNISFPSYHYEDDLPDFLDEDVDYSLNCDVHRLSPRSTRLVCESTEMKDKTTRDVGKEAETPEDLFELFFRGEDEATVPGGNTTRVDPVSPSLY